MVSSQAQFQQIGGLLRGKALTKKLDSEKRKYYYAEERKMPSIRIQDKIQRASGNFLDVHLKDILMAIGESVLSSRWACRDLWCVRKRDGKAEELRQKRLKFSGEEILQWALSAGLIIDGRFEARGQGAAKRPWLIIVAFDSTFYDVWSSKPNVIERIKERYNDVIDIPNIVQNVK